MAAPGAAAGSRQRLQRITCRLRFRVDQAMLRYPIVPMSRRRILFIAEAVFSRVVLGLDDASAERVFIGNATALLEGR